MTLKILIAMSTFISYFGGLKSRKFYHTNKTVPFLFYKVVVVGMIEETLKAGHLYADTVVVDILFLNNRAIVSSALSDEVKTQI